MERVILIRLEIARSCPASATRVDFQVKEDHLLSQLILITRALILILERNTVIIN